MGPWRLLEAAAMANSARPSACEAPTTDRRRAHLRRGQRMAACGRWQGSWSAETRATAGILLGIISGVSMPPRSPWHGCLGCRRPLRSSFRGVRRLFASCSALQEATHDTRHTRQAKGVRHLFAAHCSTPRASWAGRRKGMAAGWEPATEGFGLQSQVEARRTASWSATCPFPDRWRAAANGRAGYVTGTCAWLPGRRSLIKAQSKPSWRGQPGSAVIVIALAIALALSSRKRVDVPGDAVCRSRPSRRKQQPGLRL